MSTQNKQESTPHQAEIIKKRCVTVQRFKKGTLPFQQEVRGNRFTFWLDQSKSKGFEVRLEGDGIEVRGMGIPPGLTIEPAVSNVVTIKLRRLAPPPTSKLRSQEQ